MKINEIDFSSPWDLTENTPRSEAVKNHLRQTGVRGLIQSYEKSDDPDELIVTFAVNGAWEVHHLHVDENRQIQSGLKIHKNRRPNIGFISTARQIYERHLGRGRQVRITAPPDLWKNYSGIIKFIVKQSGGNFVTGELNTHDTSFDGSPCVSQIIQSRGKLFHGLSMEEMVKNFSTPTPGDK